MSYMAGEPCPQCGKKLAIRARRLDGKQFAGCTGYPDCKFTSNDIDMSREAPRSGIDKAEDAAAARLAPPVFDFRELECIRNLCVNSLKDGGRRFSELTIIQKIETYRDKLTGVKREARQEVAGQLELPKIKVEGAADILARAKA